MPRYHFHVRRDLVTILDQQGVELDELVEAIKEAARRALEIEAHEKLLGLPPSRGTILVYDEFETTILEVPFGDRRHQPLVRNRFRVGVAL